MNDQELSRLSVNINAQTLAELNYHLAAIRGTTRTEVIRHAVALAKFLEDERVKGRKIMTMNRREGDWRELVIVVP
ncbi:hypothetical protein SPF06_00975 [Sinomonas sp. JGH33]|uniref:Ribbon-helix-helix protein CopG domain-containing protein n=1 Tax=Sinomonas terricola TaxID=3110330 RepID=A0ABU5T0U1_9MICC|nr:hypothetical protein [Sinomonas sp. JGH33]MEA5453283.1 hypothetical protein [Sinomonas sp. JGH33]